MTHPLLLILVAMVGNVQRHITRSAMAMLAMKMLLGWCHLLKIRFMYRGA